MKNENFPTTYPELNTVLQEHASSVQRILGQNLVAIYLQGSFAVGDADLNSDVDFLVIVDSPLTDTEISALNAMHARIFEMETHWAQHLEGSYIPRELYKTKDPQRSPVPYIDNGGTKIELSNHDNDLVVRWVVREHGIPLYGPPAQTLIDPVDPDDLRQEIKQTMLEWGQEIIDGSYSIESRWAQAFVVLSYCRMLQTQETGRIQSKPEGAKWAIENLDPQWINLIESARNDREDKWKKVFMPSKVEDQKKTRKFINYALTLI